MSNLPKAQVEQLQVFITLLQAQPAILHDPALSFFRDYLVSMGAKLPSPPPEEKEPSKSPEPETIPRKEPEEMEQEEVVESDPESEVELDMTGVIGRHTRPYS